MQRTILVTGGDKTYFLMGCLLVHSLRTFAPRLPVYFLDFGLDRAQRKFLETICTVVRRPKHLDAGLHHYAFKAAIGEFLREVSWTTLVWLDGDMIAVGAIGERLKLVLKQMNDDASEVAACVDSCGTVGNFIVQVAAKGQPAAKGLPMGQFVDALAAAKISLQQPYLNVGFVVCRARSFLDEWRRLTNGFAGQLCFEQNAFNIVARTHGPVTILPAQEWNVHGRMLRENTAGLGSLILHPTSDLADDIASSEWVAFGPQRIGSRLKSFRNPMLQKFQEAILADFMRGAHRELQRLGILA